MPGPRSCTRVARAFASAGIVPVGPADSGARQPARAGRDTEPRRTDGEWRTTSLVRCVAPGEWRNWQTRRLQVPVSERMWGFKSPLAHPLPFRALRPRSVLDLACLSAYVSASSATASMIAAAGVEGYELGFASPPTADFTHASVGRVPAGRARPSGVNSTMQRRRSFASGARRTSPACSSASTSCVIVVARRLARAS